MAVCSSGPTNTGAGPMGGARAHWAVLGVEGEPHPLWSGDPSRGWGQADRVEVGCTGPCLGTTRPPGSGSFQPPADRTCQWLQLSLVPLSTPKLLKGMGVASEQVTVM